MYILTNLAKTTQDEKLRAAARTQQHGQVYASGPPGNQGGSARRLGRLRVLRGRRAAQAY